MSQYWIQNFGQTSGPMSQTELVELARSGSIAPETLVCRGEGGEWHPANKVKGLIKPLEAAESIRASRQVLLDSQTRAEPSQVAAQPPESLISLSTTGTISAGIRRHPFLAITMVAVSSGMLAVYSTTPNTKVADDVRWGTSPEEVLEVLGGQGSVPEDGYDAETVWAGQLTGRVQSRSYPIANEPYSIVYYFGESCGLQYMVLKPEI